MPSRMNMNRGAMESGERDRMITLEQRPATLSKDASGTPIDGPWTTLVEHMPASKMVIGGRERFNAQQLTSPYDTRWEINYRTDMDPELINVPKLRRVVYQGRVHDIVHADHIGRREGVELLTLARAT